MLGKLETMLIEMIDEVDKDPEYPARRVLGGGLRIVVSRAGRGGYGLLIARKGFPGPSDVEMRTVLNNWPYGVPEPPAILEGIWSDGRVGWPALQCRVPRRFL